MTDSGFLDWVALATVFSILFNILFSLLNRIFIDRENRALEEMRK